MKFRIAMALLVVGYFVAGALQTPAQTAAQTPAQALDYVKRAVFTTGIEDREPVNEVDSVSTDSTQVFFFTEIVDLPNTTVTHRWIYNGETVAEVPFQIGGPRWRVYSSKKLLPEWTGTWKVEVVDADGIAMDSRSFVYYKPE